MNERGYISGIFAGGSSNTISIYTIDATTGALTSTGRYRREHYPSRVTVDPSGKLAYVANNFSNSISMYPSTPPPGLNAHRAVGM